MRRPYKLRVRRGQRESTGEAAKPHRHASPRRKPASVTSFRVRRIAKSGILDGMLCPPAPDVIFPVAVKEGLPLVIRKLIRWRAKNGLSQRGASEVMQARGLDVPISTIKQWEQGVREPGKLAAKAVRDFLAQHPTIENPPRYRPGPK
jgi:hypothetical protein